MSNPETFINQIQKSKMMLNLKEDAKGKHAEKTPVESGKQKLAPQQKAKDNGIKKTDITPGKATPVKKTNGNSKLNVPASTKKGYAPKANVSKFPSTNTTSVKGAKVAKNESIFVLAGIEDLLVSEEQKQGALGALDIMNNYMGGNLPAEYQEFVTMFRNILSPTDNQHPSDPNVSSRNK
jgi:hypothetical protein